MFRHLFDDIMHLIYRSIPELASDYLFSAPISNSMKDVLIAFQINFKSFPFRSEVPHFISTFFVLLKKVAFVFSLTILLPFHSS